MELTSSKRFINFLSKSRKTIFSTQDLQNALDFKSPNSRNVALHRFVKDGWLTPLRKGLYGNSFHPPEKFAVAVAMLSPSYISFESALNYYGVLSQNPLVITVATTKKSGQSHFAGQLIKYSHLRPRLFFGYNKIGEILIAQPEKALLDALYMESKGLIKLAHDELDLERLDKGKLKQYARSFPKLCLPNWK